MLTIDCYINVSNPQVNNNTRDFKTDKMEIKRKGYQQHVNCEVKLDINGPTLQLAFQFFFLLTRNCFLCKV